MKVNFLDLKKSYQEQKIEFDDAFKRVMDSGWFISGTELQKFEEEFASYIGTKYCLGVGNGLDALVLVLRSLDIGPGDEVIVPATTFIATWLAVSQVGATPIPVEPALLGFNISADEIEKAITPKTKAIIPVHLYGQACNMEQIMKLANAKKIPILEDAAQAQGAITNGSKVGSFGIAAGWSFYPGKNLGAFGDAGAITTNDEGVYHRVKALRSYGSLKKYYHEFAGVNSRLDELQASFLRVKLKYLNENNSRRQSIAKIYDKALNSSQIMKPDFKEDGSNVWHLYVIRTKKRDALAEYLKSKDIEVVIHYPVAVHKSGAYKDKFANARFARSEAISDEVLSLPIDPNLEDEQVRYVAQQVNLFFNL